MNILKNEKRWEEEREYIPVCFRAFCIIKQERRGEGRRAGGERARLTSI